MEDSSKNYWARYILPWCIFNVHNNPGQSLPAPFQGLHRWPQWVVLETAGQTQRAPVGSHVPLLPKAENTVFVICITLHMLRNPPGNPLKHHLNLNSIHLPRQAQYPSILTASLGFAVLPTLPYFYFCSTQPFWASSGEGYHYWNCRWRKHMVVRLISSPMVMVNRLWMQKSAAVPALCVTGRFMIPGKSDSHWTVLPWLYISAF